MFHVQILMHLSLLSLYAGTVSQVRNDIHDAGFYVDVDSSDRKLDKKVVL
jgi:threonyl-tRNA synthetase